MMWVTMWLHIFSVLHLTVVECTATPNPTVICPSRIARGGLHTCYVSASTGTPRSNLTLTLKNATHEVAFAYPSTTSPGLFTLAVDAAVQSGQYFVQLQVDNTVDPRTRANITITPEAAAVVIETDKARYKPGQTARFRLLVLQTHTLQPLSGKKIRFAVLSPQGFKLMQVETSSDEHGVARYDFPISVEPVQGVHTARATVLDASGEQAGLHEVKFSIEEYVLPRFSVNLTCDQPHLVAQSTQNRDNIVSITGTLSATYTYLESVYGSATITAFQKVGFWHTPAFRAAGPSSSTDSKSPEYRELASTTVVRVSATNRTMFALRLAQLSSYGDVVLEASVRDSATGEIQNATVVVPVTYSGQDMHVNLATTDGSDTFKPGLPTSVRIELQAPGGNPVEQDQLSSRGPFYLVLQQHLVSYEVNRPPEVSILLRTVELATGVSVVEVSVPKDGSCCDALAQVSSEQEYLSKMGCCTSRVTLTVWHGNPQSRTRIWSPIPQGTATLCLSRAYSMTGEFLAVTPPATLASLASIRTTMNLAQINPTAEYLVLKGNSILFGASALLIDASAVQSGAYWQASMSVQIPTKVAGDLRLIIIVRAIDGGAITGSATFSRSLTWPFQLQASFSLEEARPGANASIRFKAQSVPDGTPVHAFFLSVDKSAQLLGSRAAVSSNTILKAITGAHNQFPQVVPRAWRHCHVHGLNAPVQAEVGDEVTVMPQPNSSVQTDAKATAAAFDIPWGSRLAHGCPRPISRGCSQGFMGEAVLDGQVMAVAEMAPRVATKAGESPVSGAPSSSSRTITTRKFFPETWLWSDLSLGVVSAGMTALTVPVVVPDTITSWSLEAFATTPFGLATAKPVTPLRVFKPCFVEIRLPYSAIQGEDLEVGLTAYNYVVGSNDLNITLAVVLPHEFELTNGSLQSQLWVPEDSAGRKIIRVRPRQFGTYRLRAEITTANRPPGFSCQDAVERPLIVKPPGYEVTRSQNVILQLSSGSSTVNEKVHLLLPATAVNGSARHSLSIVGDMLGPTISGLDRLLQIPTGCGEQNMITLAPNVYVGKYLVASRRLRPNLRERMVQNMIVGYGRELNYRHKDGSFSAFGEQDEEGSTWLTAFVLKTFAEVQALGFITIDSSVLQAAAAWLVAQQASDGSFRSRGKVIHKEMMGGLGTGASASSTLTSYVTAALAKAIAEVPSMGTADLQDALKRASSFLSGARSSGNYAKVLRAHALVSTGLTNTASAANEALSLSTHDAAKLLRHWSSGSSYSRDVELTGYGVILLCMAGQLTEAFQASKWLLEQRRASGGFSSTQDTVIALSALATYATQASSAVQASVQIQPSGASASTLVVDASNIDVMQSVQVPVPGSEVNLQASGTGMVLATAELTYNILDRPGTSCYDVNVTWLQKDFSSTVPASSVRGCAMPKPDCITKSLDGMFIMSVGLFTGWTPTSSSLEAIRAKGLIQRYEISPTKVDFYLDHLIASQQYCVQFDVTRDFVVQDLQPVPSEVYEYYSPESYGSTLTSYDLKTSSESKLSSDASSGTPNIFSLIPVVLLYSLRTSHVNLL